MLIRVGHEISLTFLQPTATVLMLYLHPSRAATVRKPECLQIEPWTPLSEYLDLYGNRCGRILAPSGRVVFRNNAIVEDSGEPDPQVWDAPQHNVENLPDDVLLFLLASRYCEVDSELREIASSQFSQTLSGWSPRGRDLQLCAPAYPL
jgi:hypothetical protein